jgi:hypothetical protein
VAVARALVGQAAGGDVMYSTHSAISRAVPLPTLPEI